MARGMGGPGHGPSCLRRAVDAWAIRADEGRGKATKRRGELPSELIRGSPNGATRLLL
jgi:hypothetical protein